MWRRSLSVLLVSWLVAGLACSTTSTPEAPASGDDAAPPPPDQDASSAACAAAGGTCVTFQTACPVLQQNTILCDDSVMVCCLPASDGAVFVAPDSGSVGDSAPPADTGTSPPNDSGAAVDTGSKPVDSGTTPETSTPADTGTASVEASSDGAGE